MKCFLMCVLLFVPLLLHAQGEDILTTHNLLGAIAVALGTLLIQFLSGMASKAKEWGMAWMDLRIAKLQQKRQDLPASSPGSAEL